MAIEVPRIESPTKGFPFSSGKPRKAKALSDVINTQKSSVLADDDYYNVCELLLTSPRDLILCLLLPAFALNRFDNEIFEFTSADGSFKIKIIPNKLFGRATMYDKGILLYAIGIVQQMLNERIINRNAENRMMQIDVKKMFSDIKRSGGDDLNSTSNAWNNLDDAGNRLMTTLITMEARYGKSKRTATKALFITDFELEQDGSKVLLQMRLSDWVWDAIMKERPADILSLGNEYWDMTPLKRRVYEIFRVNMGLKNTRGNSAHEVATWKYIEFEKLCGKMKHDKNFKGNLQKLFEFQHEKQSKYDTEFRKVKKRTSPPQTWGTFGIWVVGFYPDKLVVMRKDLLNIPC